MKKKIFNEDNLKDNEIDEIVTRVKSFIINSKKEMLIATSNGGVQLVGGHVEDGEEMKDTLIREIKEEAGMEIKSEEISEPLFEISHYIKNYFNSQKNVVAKMVYYIVKTDKKPDMSKIKRTKQEENYAFDLKYIAYDSFEEYVKKFEKNNKQINIVIAGEILVAFDELIEHLEAI